MTRNRLDSWEFRKPHVKAKLCKGLYVDNLGSDRRRWEEAKDLKQQTTEVFEDASFALHKRRSSAREHEDEETYAKQYLGKPNGEESSNLGLAWNKEHDEVSASFPDEKADVTKRAVLGKRSSIFYHLESAFPVTLEGELLYRAL